LKSCVRHPDRQTSYACLKHEIHMCEKCMDCRDPNIYCKFRSSCAIHFMTTRKGDLESGEAAEESSG